MSDSFEKIVAGVGRFQRDVFPGKADLFRTLGGHQHPKVLFLTCSDSRIDPTLITQMDPGELFVCRNIGNVVPPHGTADGSVAAVMEYAVDVLKVEHVVVCGHSGCGAMKSLLSPGDGAVVPRVTEWLRFAVSAKRLAAAQQPPLSADGPGYLEAVTKLNVVSQLNNLRTYPEVAARVAAGTLRTHGWFYDIATARVETTDGAAPGDFVPLA